MKDPVIKVSFAEHPYLDQSKLPDNIDSIPYRSVETLKEANQLHKMVEYFHDIASKDRFYLQLFPDVLVRVPLISTGSTEMVKR